VGYVDNDWYIRQCLNFDGLWKENTKKVKYAKEKVYNWVAAFSTKTHIDTYNGPTHWLPWEDHEIHAMIQAIVADEEEQLDILKKLPANS
jgi:hypothetical protein